MRRLQLLGKKFGRLKVLAAAGTTPEGETLWVVTCSCGSGKQKTVRGSALRHLRGCGCLNPNRLRPYEALYRRLLRDAKTARAHVVPVKLTYRQFLRFTKRARCFYCWTPLTWKAFMSCGSGYRLDRKDSKRGYSLKNCVACCTRCNRGKSDLFTFKEWRAMTAMFRK
jgi:hypothetical protein